MIGTRLGSTKTIEESFDHPMSRFILVICTFVARSHDLHAHPQAALGRAFVPSTFPS